MNITNGVRLNDFLGIVKKEINRVIFVDGMVCVAFDQNNKK